MAIPDGYRKNFDTLLDACANGDVALVECTEKATGKVTYVICAVGRDKGDYVLAPFARMFDGNPYDEILPPA